MLVKGRYVIIDPSLGKNGIREHWAVRIENNMITDSGDTKDLIKKYPEDELIGSEHDILMPGLIDAHTHGAGLSFIQRGAKLDFLENSLLWFESSMGLEPGINSMLNAVRHIKNGCTTIHHNDWTPPSYEHEVEDCKQKIDAYRSTGIRLGFSLGTRNMNILAYEDKAFLKTLPADLQKRAAYLTEIDAERAVDDFITAVHAVSEECSESTTKNFVGPSWVQGSTDDFLIRAKQCAIELGNVPFHIHCLQTPIQKCFGIRNYHKSLVAHMEDLGVLDQNTVLAHAVYVTEDDITTIAKHKAAVTHHPSCNLILRNGIAPVFAMHRAGVRVAMGLDEKSINDDEDVFMEMRMIYYLHRQTGMDLCACPALEPSDVMAMATTSASPLCGFEDSLGKLLPGKKADMILLDADKVLFDPWSSPDADLLTLIMHRAAGRFVHTSIIDGKIVMKDREILTIDEKELYSEARKQAELGPTQEQQQFRKLLFDISPYYKAWYNSWLNGLELEPFYRMNSKK